MNNKNNMNSIESKEGKEGKKDNILKDGYAPFCKHIFIKNFTDLKPGSIEITSEIEHLIKTKYEARTENELPVLSRYLPLEKVT